MLNILVVARGVGVFYELRGAVRFWYLVIMFLVYVRGMSVVFSFLTMLSVDEISRASSNYGLVFLLIVYFISHLEDFQGGLLHV